MKRVGWLIALGIGTLLVFTLVTLPAGIVAGRLEKSGVQAIAFSGSVWSGTASGLAWRSAPVGDLQWHLVPAALLRGRIEGHATLVRDDGKLDTDFSAAFDGHAQLTGTTFDFPLATLGALPIGVPKGWLGRARGKLDEIVLEGGWPTALRGTLDLDDLVTPPPRNARVGSFHVVLPHPKPQGEGSLPGHLTAEVTDRQGPFSVDAQLAVGKDRSFLLEGMVAARGGVPENMRRSLEILGPPDAEGRRPFSVSGTL